MNNKKIGLVLILLTVSFAFILMNLSNRLQNEAEDLGCFSNEGCIKIESTLNITNIAFGIMGSLLALGIYMIFFSNAEEAILKKLHDDKQLDIKKEKYDIIMGVLDEYEKRVMQAVKEQDGITQNTLRIRTDLSKAKLSYVLKELEKRNLVRREARGKTLAVYAKDF